MARQRTSSNETAFVIDEDRVAASADGVYFAGLPGLWRAGEAVHAEAFGLTLAEMRDVVETLNLPVKEVSVASDSAHRAFPPADGKLESSFVRVGPEAADPAPVALERDLGDEVQLSNLLDDAADVPADERGDTE